jgi:uncharacterized protein (DUF2164 family)
MPTNKRRKPSIEISDDARKRAIASIRRYFDETLESEIGDLKAEMVLDYVLAEHGPVIYNQAIADARAFFEERTADLDALSHHAEYTYWDSAKRPG